MKIKKYVDIIGDGETCPHCKAVMQRRKRNSLPERSNCYYSEWDYCIQCHHVQHYEQFKCYISE